LSAWLARQLKINCCNIAAAVLKLLLPGFPKRAEFLSEIV